jgi:hypothetical protein
MTGLFTSFVAHSHAKAAAAAVVAAHALRTNDDFMH